MVLVNARLSVIGWLPQVAATVPEARATDAEPKAMRQLYLGQWTQAPVFDFPALAADQRIAGPAIGESETTTVLLRPGDAARFDRCGWLDVRIDATPAAA